MMAVVEPKIVEIARESLVWPFDHSDPFIEIPRSGEGYKRPIAVDPFPAYTHDPDVVRAALKAVAEFWPSPYPVTYYISPYEAWGRTNASAYAEPSRYKDENNFWVMVHGKRLPPHPAMTRYLVAHEYGHLIEIWLELHQHGRAEEHPSRTIKEYAAYRGLDTIYGRGGTWHKAAQEVFACDFRWYAGFELEFWPHLGVPKPPDDRSECLLNFWAQKREQWLQHIETGADTAIRQIKEP